MILTKKTGLCLSSRPSIPSCLCPTNFGDTKMERNLSTERHSLYSFWCVVKGKKDSKVSTFPFLPNGIHSLSIHLFERWMHGKFLVTKWSILVLVLLSTDYMFLLWHKRSKFLLRNQNINAIESSNTNANSVQTINSRKIKLSNHMNAFGLNVNKALFKAMLQEKKNSQQSSSAMIYSA